MSQRRDEVEGTIRSFLKRAKKDKGDIKLDTSLYAEGIGTRFAPDRRAVGDARGRAWQRPVQRGEVPETMEEIVDFYDPPKPGT